MKRHQIHIFATKADLCELVQAIESKQGLQYVKSGLFDLPLLDRLETLLDSNLGIAVKGDNNHENAYLVAGREEIIRAEIVPQYGGGTKHSVSQKTNPKSIIFQPGGVFENCVISGSAGTISEDPASLALFKLFSKEIKKQFNKVKSFHVGKEAQNLMEKGWRLTTSVKSPPLYDLKKD